MRAVIFKEHGGLEKLIYTEAPRPKIGPHEILVKVKACALNHLDIWTRLGMPGVSISMPHILGCDIAGEISEIGSKVKHFKIGKRVVVAPGFTPPNDSLKNTDWDSASDHYKILGCQVDGGYAEYVKVPAENVFPVSKRLSFEEWAAVPLVFLTAWHMLVTRAKLKKGETVLIQAAGSGVGSAAIQLAKHIGAKIIATVGNDEKKTRAIGIGANWVVNYNKTDFSKEVRAITKSKGVDVVLEHIGPDTFNKSLACLAKRGRLVTCGVTSGPSVQLDLRFLFSRQYSIMGCYMGGLKEFKEMLKVVEAGKVRPTLDKVFPLKEARRAQERMLSRQNFGKIVLVP